MSFGNTKNSRQQILAPSNNNNYLINNDDCETAFNGTLKRTLIHTRMQTARIIMYVQYGIWGIEINYLASMVTYSYYAIIIFFNIFIDYNRRRHTRLNIYFLSPYWYWFACCILKKRAFNVYLVEVKRYQKILSRIWLYVHQ